MIVCAVVRSECRLPQLHRFSSSRRLCCAPSWATTCQHATSLSALLGAAVVFEKSVSTNRCGDFSSLRVVGCSNAHRHRGCSTLNCMPVLLNSNYQSLFTQ